MHVLQPNCSFVWGSRPSHRVQAPVATIFDSLKVEPEWLSWTKDLFAGSRCRLLAIKAALGSQDNVKYDICILRWRAETWLSKGKQDYESLPTEHV